MAFSCAEHRPQAWPASEQGKKREPVDTGHDELRELSETFQQTVRRLSSLVRELEAAHEHTLQIELEKKQFYREVIRAVTRGKFELVDPGDVPQLGTLLHDLPAATGPEYAAARGVVRQVSSASGMSEDRCADLLLAAGEAITNAMKHATEGRCLLYQSDDALTIRVTDRGGGIASHQLPATILTPGFSTKVSLGMGYTMMLKLCDRVWLATGPEGTLIQLEKKLEEPPAEGPSLLANFNGL
jgi:anti-sigma regulatory factor (Ser/Thr protein kinase)